MVVSNWESRAWGFPLGSGIQERVGKQTTVGEIGSQRPLCKKGINSFDCLLLKIFKNVLEVN